MFYFVKTPWWLKKLFTDCTWQMPAGEKIIYLTFDDGPHPVATTFVLNELRKYEARATFFCVGNNVMEHPEIYKRIILEGHAVGNHTFSHLNGWKTKDDEYLNNVGVAKKYIDSNLFRPPYGKITKFQQALLSKNYKLLTIMWTVLSGDFDTTISDQKCLNNVIANSGNGSIIVFHDSEKALEKMSFTLPKVLQHFSDKGYRFKQIVI